MRSGFDRECKRARQCSHRSRFSHAWPRGDDRLFAELQAVCQVVEPIEAGNKPAAASLKVETTLEVIYHAERAIVGGQRCRLRRRRCRLAAQVAAAEHPECDMEHSELNC